ncbi:MAG TPA: methylenetetrahydrofolate reductase [NAD(P)H], partial [Flavobacteriales bacterium]|nr:methylenetetrahydrofolate reductase [NAD(P)H] [Flavobacteriales bacterium]
QLTFIPKFFHVNLPDELVDEIEKCKSDEEVKQVGIEWGIKQSKELIQKGAPCIHYYTMGKSSAVKEIARAVF